LRGSGRFRHGPWDDPPQRFVSIPFIAGQWSLPGAELDLAAALIEFQSPSLRGSGRFTMILRRPLRICDVFQSPSLRGSGRFTGR